MATISLNLSHEEFVLFNDFAKMKKMTIENLLKKTLLEKIEDEYDIAVAAEAYQDYVSNGKKSRPFSELKKELGL